MSYLTLDADRLVRDAVEAFIDDRLRPESSGDCVYATRNNQYRLSEGDVIEATDTTLIGASLVGWLIEEMGQPVIEPRWRPYARALFVERKSRQVVVTSRTLTRSVVSGNVPPVPARARKASIIPPSPPIPVLRGIATPPLSDGSPTPYYVGKAVKEAAERLQTQHERPTTRPPPEEQTVARDRSSYEDLLEASRTPDWNDPDTLPRSVRLPLADPDDPPPSQEDFDAPTKVGRSPIESIDDGELIEIEPDDE